MRSCRALIAGLFFAVTTLTSFGQEEPQPQVSCDETLTRAESEFAAGHFYAIPQILQKCIEPGNLSTEQSVRAFLILCQAYLLTDDPIAAEDSYLKLLKADPEFVPNDKEHPIDIVYLSKKFTATPIFTPHLRLGVNTSFYREIHTISTEPYGPNNDYPIRFGVQLGGGLDWNINDNVSLCGELYFATRGYELILRSGSNPDETNVIASQTWIDFPLYVKYTFNLNPKIRPFGYVGGALNYLLSATNQATHTDSKSTGPQLVAEGPVDNVTIQRNQFNQSIVFGGGAYYKIGKNFLFADLRYMVGLSNLANPSQIYYADPSLINPAQIGDPDHYMSGSVTKYHNVSSLFRLDNLSLTFGYVKPLYNPRRVKKARTKGVFKSIRKQGKAVK